MRYLSLCLSCVAALGLPGCGFKFPDAPWMNKDPLSFITSGPKERVPEVTAQDIDPVAAVEPVELAEDGSMGILGLNLETYFAGERPTEERVERLERVVTALQKDLQEIVPALQKTNHNQDITDQTPVDAMMAHTPTAPDLHEPINLTQIDRGPRAVNVPSTTVTGIRVGTHPGYVRIVFDVTGPTPYTVDLDNGEKILVVELSGTRWQPPVMSEFFGRAPLLRSYKVNAMGDGSGHIFVMQLKNTTTISKQKIYPALSGGGKRIVIDLRT